MSDSQTSKDESHDVSLVEAPPTTIGGILRRLGPGLIVAGSIVGSGELIATTATGAQAGFWLLWLILIGCVIKVFVQVELGRYTIASGKTTMEGLSQVPGPRIPNRGNWLVWYWFIMFMASLAQLGGIVGGVGQALAISLPLTEDGRTYDAYAKAETSLLVAQAELRLKQEQLAGDKTAAADVNALKRKIFQLERQSNHHLIELLELRQSEPEQWTAIETTRAFFARHEQPSAELIHLVSTLHPAAMKAAELRLAQQALDKGKTDEQSVVQLRSEAEQLRAASQALERELDSIAITATYLSARSLGKPKAPRDDKLWATVVTVITAFILFYGRYGLIQSFATTMVALFTVITIVNLFFLQSNPSWGVSMTDIINGMSFRLPPTASGEKARALATALATFGIIGVGASELVTYPYWCMEKGYARFTGPRSDQPEWASRARGWLRVMRWDAWCSMVVYTFATIAFYLLGAAILGRTGLDPKGTQMIRYLSVMYEPVFGQIAQTLFLFGAFAVLYSTFFVANASQARVFSDALRVLRFAPEGELAHRKRVRIFSAMLPFVCLSFYWSGWDPQKLVLLSGLMQAMMLPMLAAAALYFRYRRTDSRILPSRFWDVFLWISAVGMLIAGVWAAYARLTS